MTQATTTCTRRPQEHNNIGVGVGGGSNENRHNECIARTKKKHETQMSGVVKNKHNTRNTALEVPCTNPISSVMVPRCLLGTRTRRAEVTTLGAQVRLTKRPAKQALETGRREQMQEVSANARANEFYLVFAWSSSRQRGQSDLSMYLFRFLSDGGKIEAAVAVKYETIGQQAGEKHTPNTTVPPPNKEHCGCADSTFVSLVRWGKRLVLH